MRVPGAGQPSRRQKAPQEIVVSDIQKYATLVGRTGRSSGSPSSEPIRNVPPGTQFMPSAGGCCGMRSAIGAIAAVSHASTAAEITRSV